MAAAAGQERRGATTWWGDEEEGRRRGGSGDIGAWWSGQGGVTTRRIAWTATRSGGDVEERTGKGRGGAAVARWRARGGDVRRLARLGESTGRRRQESRGGERSPRGKQVDRVWPSRGVGFQMTKSSGPCLPFHAGWRSGEKSGIPEGF